MFKFFRGLLGGNKEVPFVPVEAPVQMQPVMGGGAVQSDNEAPYDWVGNANLALAQTLKRLPVKLYGSESAASAMPIDSVSLGGAKANEGFLMGHGTGGHETATLTLHMRDNVGNYDVGAVNKAVHAVLGSIPALAGKVKFAKDLSQQALSHEDILNQLKGIVSSSGKFSKQEIGLLSEYFDQDKQASVEDPDWGRINMEHSDGKVQMHIRPAPLKGDESVAVSGEARLVDYFKEHKEAILQHMRQKIAALKVLTAEEIASLDFSAAIMKADWGDQPTIEFGSKAGADGKL
jgi:hypothetical protein